MEPGFFPPHSGPRGGVACAGAWGPAELFSAQRAPGIWQCWHWRGLAALPHWARRVDVGDLKPCRFRLP